MSSGGTSVSGAQYDHRKSQEAELNSKAQPIRVPTALPNQRHLGVSECVVGCPFLRFSRYCQDLAALGNCEQGT